MQLFSRRTSNGHGDLEFSELCETCDTCISVTELFKSSVSLFAKVSVSQLRKDFVEGLKIQKGKGLRRKVSEKKEKRDLLKFDLTFIRKNL